VDQPIPTIKKMIRAILSKEDAEYIFTLDEFNKYTRVVGERFWSRMGKTMGTR
jgi:hypothetical protein